MSRHFLFAILLTLVSVAAALVSGPYRRGALIGVIGSCATALLSLVLMQQSARVSKVAVQAALLVMVFMFLVRIGVVAVGTAVVARGGANIFAFIIAFFVPYFLFAAIEGAYVHSLSRRSGPAT